MLTRRIALAASLAALAVPRGEQSGRLGQPLAHLANDDRKRQ